MSTVTTLEADTHLQAIVSIPGSGMVDSIDISDLGSFRKLVDPCLYDSPIRSLVTPSAWGAALLAGTEDLLPWRSAQLPSTLGISWAGYVYGTVRLSYVSDVGWKVTARTLFTHPVKTPGTMGARLFIDVPAPKDGCDPT